MSATSIPIKSDGRFAGYASVFGQVDQGGDIVMAGAFKKSLAKKGASGIRMLFQHDPKEPVGIWEVIKEDGFGLWVEGRLLAGIARSDSLRTLIENKALDGLSIGFRTERASKDKVNSYRRLWQINLWEISIVTFPMMEGARISSGAILVDSDMRLAQSLDAAISLFRN
jgi:hypothetical protein